MSFHRKYIGDIKVQSNQEALIKFGKNLRKIREEKRMTIAELSIKSGIRKEYINNIEQGKARGLKISHIWELSSVLNIKPHVLCKGI